MSGHQDRDRLKCPRHILNLVAEPSGHDITSSQKTKHQPSLYYTRCWKALERILLARERAGLRRGGASFRDGQTGGRVRRCEEIAVPGLEQRRVLLSGEWGVRGHSRYLLESIAHPNIFTAYSPANH